MDNITNVRITDFGESLYLKTVRMQYDQDGKQKSLDIMRKHDGLTVIIFNVTRQVLIFVKQFRPGIYLAQIKVEDIGDTIDTKKYPPSSAIAIELCGGMVDKCKSLEEIAKEEVLEECGYDVPLSSFQKVSSHRTRVEMSGTCHTLFYVEVTDTMKVSEGGGIVSEGECIEVIEMDLSKAYSLIYDETVERPASLILGLIWFFQHKSPAELEKKL